MNKIKKLCIKVGMVLIVITFCVLLLNRSIYGTFNVFSNPNKIYVRGILYTTNGYVVTLKGKDKPKAAHQISGILDRLTGKRIYYTVPNYLDPGEPIYLHLDGDKYLVFGWGGGA